MWSKQSCLHKPVGAILIIANCPRVIFIQFHADLQIQTMPSFAALAQVFLSQQWFSLTLYITILVTQFLVFNCADQSPSDEVNASFFPVLTGLWLRLIKPCKGADYLHNTCRGSSPWMNKPFRIVFCKVHSRHRWDENFFFPWIEVFVLKCVVSTNIHPPLLYKLKGPRGSLKVQVTLTFHSSVLCPDIVTSLLLSKGKVGNTSS